MLHSCVNKKTSPHAYMHTGSLTHSSSRNHVQQLNPSIMLLLQPPQGRERKQEGTQLRIDAKPWERFRLIFHSFLINSKMNYPYAVTNQVASILQSSSAFKCLFIWCKVFFLFLMYAMCELVQAQKSTLVCYWTSFLLLSPENTCLTVIYLLAIPICLHYSTTWQ